MKTGAHTIFDDVSKLIDGITRLTSTRVMVGVPEDKTERDDNSPITNADLAYIHENGAPEANIPARPFMYPGIEDAQDRITDKLEQTGNAALDGKPDAVDRGYAATGLIAQAAIRKKITDGPFVPLAESTLEARARRGRKGAAKELASRAAGNAASTEFAKPLIDKGELRNAINFVVRKA